MKLNNKKPTFFMAAIFIFFTLFYSCAKGENSILIASGAGYKKPVIEVCEEFSKKSGIRVDTIFGNMQTVSTQTKQSGQISILIGDKKFLQNTTLGLNYENYTIIGTGKLVLAYPKGKQIKEIDELMNTEIKKISMPDTAKAIYGIAAREFLASKGIWNKLQDKILIAATVPMVSSYLIAGEVDAGFINLTDAIGIADELGGYIILDSGYTPIQIVAGTVKGFENKQEIMQFTTFLESSEAIKIFSSYGL